VIKIFHLGLVALLALSGIAAFSTAGDVEAQVTGGAARAWVSGHGVDQAGCGSPTSPCRSLQYAHDNAVGAGGEIDILDPAGYGAITIRKSISIVNDGVGTAGVQAAGGNAIVINAGPNDGVFLRGLNIDGDMMSGSMGIVLHTGASLTVINCVIRHFAGNGILLQPTSPTVNILIQDTITSDNGIAGISVGGLHWTSTSTILALIDHVTSVNNQFGLYSFVLTDSSPTAAPILGISNCNFGNNTQDGIELIGGGTSIHDCQIIDNGYGIEASSQAVVALSGSDIEWNITDISNGDVSNGFVTYGNNAYFQSVGGALLPRSLH
jgi:hypothetical protein